MKKLMIALAFIGLGSVANAQTTSVETPSKYTVATNSFWSNWFVQVGVDMSLQNPPGTKFSEVFPKGKSFGANVAVGKWFSPEIGVRVKANWENGIIKANRPHNTWTPLGDDGGYLGVFFDTELNLSNIICGYNENRVWNISVFPRLGFYRNFEVNKYKPAIGGGLESTWKISKLINIYLDAAYVTTSKGFNVAPDANLADKGGFEYTYGILSVDLGVTFNIGKSTWSKAVPVETYNALAASSEEALSKLRSDLDRERQVNADLRSQLAKASSNTPAKVETKKVIASSATSVFFNINSSKIVSKKDLINIEAIASAAKNSDAKVVVTGAADGKTGSSAYNQKLSEARAKAVADELVNLGVSRDKIETKGIGGVNDVAPYTLNRRAIIELK